MRAHVLEGNTIINTIEVDSLDFLPGLIEATSGGIGWTYQDGVFTPPEPQTEVPSVVSRFQARAALYQAGLLDQVETFMSLPETDMMAKLAWADAQEFKRTSPTIAAMALVIGFTEAQLDDLFILAATIDA